MKTLKCAVLLLCCSLPLFAGQPARLGKLLGRVYPAVGEGERLVVLVSFADKGAADGSQTYSASSLVSERSIKRRLKVRAASEVVDALDLPVRRAYVDAVRAHVVSVRHELKWFNAVSVVATKPQIEALSRLPFVTEIEIVNRWKTRPGDEQPSIAKGEEDLQAPNATTSLDYGTSLTQNAQINVPAVHDLGIYGQGVVIGVFDNGFRNPQHRAFDGMHIIAQHDFVDHKESVVPNAPETGYGSHGNWTLSCIGGYVPGQLIGPAFHASFILARTENDSSETPIEEDNWAAAIEWADSIGVDVTSTSLGYSTFDPPYTSLTSADMNGTTALITRAADRAVNLGIVVVNAAGNEGAGDGIHNTLIAPADGIDVITAGAVSSAGTRASFSSVGPTTDVPARIKPDIMAMGVSVKLASATDTVNYVNLSGTSFACPLSAGVAALILSSNPTLTPHQVREAMRNTANNAGSPNNQYGWGILNALAAVNYFGALPFPRIHGHVFHDANNDSTKDWGEVGVAGVTVRLSGATADTVLTDSLGNFTFSGLLVGSYSVAIDAPTGWIKTFPQGNAVAVSVDSLMANVGGVEFGLLRLGRISGSVFRDLNSNGALDAGEPPLAGRVFHLAGLPVLRSVSDSAGAFSFSGLLPGSYVLSESTQTGSQQTFPPSGVDTFTVVGGTDTSGIRFGDFVLGEYVVSAGWNMLSLPQNVTDHSVGTIYPSATSSAYGYGLGYHVLDSIPEGVGYWLKFGSSEIVSMSGSPVLLDSVAVVAGWNLIGSLSFAIPAGSIVQIPDSTLTTGFFGYSSSQYETALTLQPQRGYWVKAGKNGVLVMSTSLAAQTVPVPVQEPSVRPLGWVSVRDAAGSEQRLSINDGADLRDASLELPPVPPAGVFDVRFRSSRAAEFLQGEAGVFPLLISSAAYPLTVRWSGPVQTSVSLLAGDKAYDLSPGAPVKIPHAASGISIDIRRSGSGVAPASFALEQNYPNPFNPSTTIGYALATPSHVRLKVVSVLGEIVATIVDEDLPAGTFRSVWNAANASSGIYYYTLQAGAYTATRKLVVLK